MEPMPRQIHERGRVASAWLLSILGHLVAVGMGGLLMAGLSGRPTPLPVPVPRSPAREAPVEIELPTVLDGTLATATPSPPDLPPLPLARGGGEAMPRPDMGMHGRGGTDTAPEPAQNLADRDEELLLSPEVHTRIDRSQIQRIRSSTRRASREDWRASREPMELTFLASGRTGARPERRTPADADPSVGARDQGAPQRVGGVLGAAELPGGVGQPRPRDVGGPVEGAEHASSGIGVRDGAPGKDHRESAKVALARPMVQEGTPSVPATVQGKPSDTLDSEQEVATALQSIVHASTAGGASGPGKGGHDGPGVTGSGGVTGPGSSSRALGTGQGAGLDNDPRDRRRSDYIRSALAKVSRLYGQDALPKWAQLEGRQGTAIITFTILADGNIASVTISRPSGIPEFDENCRRIVLRAAPFAPLPTEFGQSYRWPMPFNMMNPAVRPRGAKASKDDP
jgi:TonB family protein